MAQVIPLVNPSFESPDVTPNPNDPNNPFNGVSPEIDNWEETGPVSPLFFTTIDTGVFYNVPIDVIPPVGNADGNNLAFLVINTAADGVTEERVSIWQESQALFEASTPYAFTLSLGQSVTGPPSADTSVVLSIGYLATGSGDFVSVVDRVVTPAQMKNPYDPVLLADPNYPLLSDFTVAGYATGPAIGQEIVVKATLMVGSESTGSFIADHARLEELLVADLDFDGDVDDADFGLSFAAFTGPGNGPSSNPLADLDQDGDVDDADFGLSFAAFTGPGVSATVPEPASLSLLAWAGAVCLRRRR